MIVIVVVCRGGQGLGFDGLPLRLHHLPGIARAQLLADVRVDGFDCGNPLVDLRLLGNHIVLAGGIAIEQREGLCVVSNHLRGQVSDCVQIASALDFEARLADLLRGIGHVEHSDQRGRNGHRDHEDRELLPQL